MGPGGKVGVSDCCPHSQWVRLHLDLHGVDDTWMERRNDVPVR
jgi:hypothetical protein